MQSNRLMLIIAIVAGVVATLMAFTYISSATKSLEGSEGEETVSIIFALNNLDANRVIEPDTDLSTNNVGTLSSPGLVHAAVKADEMESLRGRRINAPIPAGMPILYAHLAGVQDIELAANSRAMGITVTDEGIMGGILVPGDRVDILVGFVGPDPEGGAAEREPQFDASNPNAMMSAIFSQVAQRAVSPANWEVESVLENVRIIAIGDRLGKSRQQHVYSRESGLEDFAAGVSPINIVTLEVTTEQAKQLIKAQAGGSNPLYLLLRPGSPGVIMTEESAVQQGG